jgi:hypothetical protein
MSQGSPRHPAEKAGFDRRADCASSRVRSSPPKAQADKDDETFNHHFIKGCRGPTGAVEAGDQSDASHTLPPPTAPSKPPLHERIRGKPGAYTPDMLVQGKRNKVACAHAEGQGEKWDTR